MRPGTDYNNTALPAGDLNMSMARYLGVDWAGTGWVTAVLRDAAAPTVTFYPTILNLWLDHDDAATILIDIPIGLREAGKRTCDVAAKARLGGDRQRSVFLTPTREAVYAPDIETAKRRQQPEEFGIQNQAWAIVPRIREVDAFLQKFAGSVSEDQILEAHPELCFWALNGHTPMTHPKETEEGIAERLELLAGLDPDLETAFEEGVRSLTEPTYAPMIGKTQTDDILDALAPAYTAKLGHDQIERLPPVTESERDGLLMRDIEMVYYPVE